MIKYDGPRFAIVSHVLPPAWSGQAVVLSHLLEGFDANKFCLISDGELDGNATSVLRAPVYKLDPDSWGVFSQRIGRLGRFLISAQVSHRARQIEKILQRENIRVVLACSGSLLDIPAAALAARRVGAAFAPYFFDDYLFQWISWRRVEARRLEAESIVGACGAIVPNEFLANAYRQRYGLESTVVRNPVEIFGAKYLVGDRDPMNKQIVYTGSVYHAHYDAFRNLIQAMALTEGDLTLSIYTAQSSDELKSHGIHGDRVKIMGHVSQKEARNLQQQADIVFLPLAFSSEIPEVIRTSSPGKLGEYLLSRRPILVHAPDDTFISWYVRKHECGYVCDTLDPKYLAEVIQMILSDTDKQKLICNRAVQRAVEDFSVDVAQKTLSDFLSGCSVAGLNL